MSKPQSKSASDMQSSELEFPEVKALFIKLQWKE